nr:contractile injection system protein, VgrG/Pvc8 family [Enterobacter bugandensis]
MLGEHQVNVEDKLTGSYRVWDYCVQYQESSLDFISRLMELEGIRPGPSDYYRPRV